MKREAPATTAKRQDDSNNISPRFKRLLIALYRAKAGLKREDADKAIPTVNAPEYIRQLKERYGLEIPREDVPFITIDGVKSRRGVYHLTEDDRRRIKALLQ